MSTESKISAIVAVQLGTIQGVIESKIRDRVEEEIFKLITRCPNIIGLQKTILKTNKLLSTINSFRKRLNSFNIFVETLTNILPIISSLIRIQKNLPIPTSTPPGVGVTLGVTNSSAERLANSERFLNNTQQDLEGVKSLIESGERSFDAILNIFKELNIRLDICINTLPVEERDTLRERIQIPDFNTSGSSRTPRPSENNTESSETTITHRATNGQVFILEISTEIDKQTGLQRRRAVAKNKKGIIIIRGELSFSSDTEVLIEDLKFRLDNII